MNHYPSKNPSGTEAINYQQLFNAMDAGLAIHKVIRENDGQTVDTEIVDVNPTWERIMGGTRAEVIGKRLSSFLLMEPTNGDHILNIYGRVSATGQSETVEIYSKWSNRYYQVSFVRIMEGYVASAFRDITETHRSEVTFQSIFNAASDAIFVHDIDTGALVELNLSGAEMLGIPKEEAIGRTQLPNLPVSYRQDQLALFKQAEQGEAVKTSVFSSEANHDFKWYELTIKALDVGGRVRAVVRFHDITEAKRQQDALVESEERYRSVSEIASDYAYAVKIERDGRAVLSWITDAFTTITGYTKAEAFAAVNKEGTAWYSLLVHPEEQVKVRQNWNRLLAEGEVETEIRLVRKDGSEIWAQSHIKAVFSPEGRATGFIGAVKDISERIRAENAYKTIFDSVHDAIFIHDIQTGKIVDLNARAVALMGYPRQVVIGSIQMPHETMAVARNRAMLIMQAAKGKIVKDESSYITRNGNEIWIESRFQVAVIGGKKRVIAAARDITDRKQVLAALEKSEERYRAVSELASDFAFSMVINAASQWNVGWVTDAFTRLTGFTLDEMTDADLDSIDSPVFLLEKLIHPDDRWLLARPMENLLAEPSFESEFRLVRRDGSPIWIRAAIRATLDENRVVGLTGAVKDITHQIHAENNYRAIFETVNDALLVLDAVDGSVLDANPNGDKMLIEGWTESKARQIPGNLFPHLSHDTFLSIIHSAAAGKTQEHEWQESGPDGQKRWMKARLTPLTVNGQTRVLAVFREAAG